MAKPKKRKAKGCASGCQYVVIEWAVTSHLGQPARQEATQLMCARCQTVVPAPAIEGTPISTGR